MFSGQRYWTNSNSNSSSSSESKKISVIFLHGFLGSAIEWLPLASKLPHWIQSFLLDLPGHGESTLSTLEEWSRWVHLFQAQEEGHLLDHPFIVGYSMGGRVALSLVHHQRLSGVCGLFLESASFGESDPRLRAERRLKDRALLTPVIDGVIGWRQFLLNWYEQPLFCGMSDHPNFDQLLREREAGGEPLGRLRRLQQALFSLSASEFPSMTNVLKKVPVSYVTGENDERYSAIAKQMRESLETVDIVPDASHNVHFMQTDRYREILVKTILRTLKH
jgi:2-succinyl-6-hydroxy-2,4-cyclohexadiene-1-carboxylate synthase